MINWAETLRAYKNLLDWPHYNEATQELCYYYQNKCRFFNDNYLLEKKDIVFYYQEQILKRLGKYMDKELCSGYQHNCRFYGDE